MHIYRLLLSALLFSATFCYPMRYSRALQAAKKRFMPQLSVTHHDPRTLITELQEKNQTVASHVIKELKKARKRIYNALRQEWRLTEQDIRKTQRIRRLVRAHDHKAYDRSLPKVIPQEYASLEIIDDIMHNVQAQLTVRIDPNLPQVAHVGRSLESLVVEVNNEIIIGVPLQIPIDHPRLTLSTTVFNILSGEEQRGALIRALAGQLGLEHQTERHLLKRLIVAKGKLSPSTSYSFEDFALLQAVEADVIPALKDGKSAGSIYAWLLREFYELGDPEGSMAERIANVEAICELHDVQGKIGPPE